MGVYLSGGPGGGGRGEWGVIPTEATCSQKPAETFYQFSMLTLLNILIRVSLKSMQRGQLMSTEFSEWPFSVCGGVGSRMQGVGRRLSSLCTFFNYACCA